MIVTVVWATPEVQDVVAVTIQPGATIADAVVLSAVIARHGIDRTAIGYAIFGRRSPADTVLRDGDRVELTRPLLADPKAARARRARAKPLAEAAPRTRRGRAD